MNKAIFLILLLLMPFVFADEPIFFYKDDTTIDLKIPCANNGSVCSNTSTCNMTISYPNSSIFVNNQLMTNQVSFHNYTLPSSSQIGDYQAIVFCTDSGVSGDTTFKFRINRMGEDDTNLKKSGMYFIIILITVVYLYCSFKMDAEHLIMKVAFFFVGIANAICGFFIAYLDLLNYGSLPDVLIGFFTTHMILFISMVLLWWFYYLKKLATRKENED